MKKTEKIIKALEGESKRDIERDILESFGFVWITDIGTHTDGGLLIVEGLEEDNKEAELWVDWKRRRILLYKCGWDLDIIEGELTKEEEDLYYEEG